MSAFPCPTPGCGATSTDILDTRERPQTIWRRRRCVNGHRFTTTEAARPPIPDDYGTASSGMSLATAR